VSLSPALDRFGADYALHRAAEGRALPFDAVASLPYLHKGPFARQWAVKARSFEAFVRRVLWPLARTRKGPLFTLDLGAGNGWLSHRLAREGHFGLAVDIREDAIDGLGVARALLSGTGFECRVASFDRLPVADAAADLAIFNAALHYSSDLAVTLREARRVVRAGGRIVILDSPFYRRDAGGAAMVAEKHARAEATFGARADSLLGLGCIEYLTLEALTAASAGLAIRWRRHRVRYPLWYELRPLLAALRRRRPPSRFDLWEGEVA
jgi:SAM-dependent methyltransferase